MDPILGTIPQTPPPWVRDVFLELRRLRQRASTKPEECREPVSILLRPDRFTEFRQYVEEMHTDGQMKPAPVRMELGGLPILKGPAKMPEPGWKIELQVL